MRLATQKVERVLDEPEIIGYGRDRVHHYEVDELRNALTCSFEGKRDGFVVLDSNPRFQTFESACIAWGLDERLLYLDEIAEGDQDTVVSFRLTKVGKKALFG